MKYHLYLGALLAPTFALADVSNFHKTCSDIALSKDGTTITANCRRSNGSMNATSISLKGVHYVDGRLTLGEGESDYQKSCDGIRLQIPTKTNNLPEVRLTAICRTKGQRPSNTQLSLPGIQNIDGVLRASAARHAGGGASDRDRKKQTIADLRSITAAFEALMTDREGGPPTPGHPYHGKNAGGTLHLVHYTKRSADFMEKFFGNGLYTKDFPRDGMYIRSVPRKDGWGNDFEFYLHEGLQCRDVLLVRSPGRDGRYSGSVYQESRRVAPDAYDEDLVFSLWR